jgi:gamma-glutamyl-gamma-aminobutyrate hydrolase PuuD
VAAPLVALTVADPNSQADPEAARRRNALYAGAVARHGGQPILLSSATPPDERRAALDTMHGLLLSGGTDIDPARYGAATAGSRDVDRARDALEAEAWQVAEARELPVLGICRGLQAINVFSGGRLLQDVAGHAGPAWGRGVALTHPLRLVPGTRLARILSPTNIRGGVVQVNSYHHQAVLPAGLAPGLVAAGTASSPAGEIVEAVETRAGRFVVGVQCHPERQESTPPAFERLFAVFVDACRGPSAARRG